MLANLIQPWTKRRLRPAMFLGGGMKQHEEDKKVKLRRMLDEAKRRAEA